MLKPSRDLFVQYRVINGSKYILKNYKVFLLDEVGEIIWDSLDGKTTLQQIAEQISIKYQIEVETALDDIEHFINELLEKELIEVT
ncbi:PqqD family protein [Paenibacillus chitinolyticus]|uniref:PqqD family protein n=1 Tax=Paenibacillus chitinolyticus TaxID=79263 RepID=UPI0035DC7DEC